MQICVAHYPRLAAAFGIPYYLYMAEKEDRFLAEPEILYENDDFLAVYKPNGLIVHSVRIRTGVSRPPENTLVEWLIRKYPEMKKIGDDPELRPGIVHRLDRDTSGVMLAAKNQPAFNLLKEMFATRQIKKTYAALVFGRIDKPGSVDAPIGIKNGSVKRSTRAHRMVKPAVTEYVPVRPGLEVSLIKAIPLTGRTHQIRVHLASIGHPVVGDPLYGRRRQPEWARRLYLHAWLLELSWPNSGRLLLESPLPPEFESALKIVSE